MNSENHDDAKVDTYIFSAVLYTNYFDIPKQSYSHMYM